MRLPRVGVYLPHVVLHAVGSDDLSGPTHRHGLFPRDDSDSLGSILEAPVVEKRGVVVRNAAADRVECADHPVREALGEVPPHATRPDVYVVDPASGQLLEQVQDQVPVVHGPVGDRVETEHVGVGPQAEEV